MKVIEGTPEEIYQYYLKSKSLKTEREQKIPSGLGTTVKRAMHRLDSHWSNTKHTWVPIAEMDESYIVNVIKKMCRENSNLILLQDKEFKALIINLADKIEEKL